MATYGPVQPQPKRGWFKRLLGFFDTTGKVVGTITALVTAIIGLFALVNQWTGHTPAPGPSSSPASNELVVADRVARCVEVHDLSTSSELEKDPSGRPIAAHLCQWPPAAYSNPDGYSKISILMVGRSNTSEAAGDTWSDRVRGPCQEFELTYDYGKMGESDRLPAFKAVPGDVLFLAGRQAEPWSRPKKDLTFYPDRDEAVVVHNSGYYLVAARCNA
jgi:hypothetical protein